MNKIEYQTVRVIGWAKESQAKTATDWAWELAEKFYTGKQISNRRVDMYVNAIIDLANDGLLQRTDSDKFFGLTDEEYELFG